MSEWRECTLGSLLDVKHGYAFLGEHFGDQGSHIVLTPGNFFEKGGFRAKGEKEKWYSGPVPQEYVLRAGDVVVAMTEQAEGLLGSSAKVPLDERYLHNQRLGLVCPKPEVDLDFVYHLFNTPLVRQQIRATASGAKVRHTSPSRIAAVKVRVPELSAQRHLAKILSAYDDLIRNCERRIKVLDEMARAVYHEWFVELRYPGAGHETLVDLELGRVPIHWATGRLDAFLDVLETGNRPKGGVGEILEGIPSIGAESIIGVGQFDFSKTKYVPPDYFQTMRSGIVRDRDVLIYKDGGRPGIFTPHVALFGSGFPFAEMGINSHVYRVRAKPGVSQEYLYYYLSSESVLHWMHLHGSGAAIPSLAREDLKQLPFVRPDASSLRRFDGFVQPIVAQILVLAREARCLRMARDMLLPRLLSGDLAVAEPA